MVWEFWVDVGGTFTDCVARAPDGGLRTFKTLSSGITKGTVSQRPEPRVFLDAGRAGDPERFWNNYALSILDRSGEVVARRQVCHFSPSAGFTLDEELPADVGVGTAYELSSGEESPLLAIRYLLGLQLEDPLPALKLRLGTTRGTNALLERRGARVAYVTTRGFGDLLLIGNQSRPRLFDLRIHKPSALFSEVVEIDERITTEGDVLVAIDEHRVRDQLRQLQQTGFDSIAICLLHGFVNPQHEILVERVARELGFLEISRSSRVAPLIKAVSRGDTTVVDAYLNPVLRDYVNGLRAGLSGDVADDRGEPSRAVFRIMTSAGGLVDADHFVGKDSLLSGPAGGVVGYAHVARQAGFSRAIGFDMGGTSTDVSRFAGDLEREFETEKGGVRIVAPMMAIETVAAGGGSVCRYDGTKLVVGPESAGADPGPACYGRGGPLTVTDANLFLGRLPSQHFPFRLELAAVGERLEEVSRQIAATSGEVSLSLEELANGFVEIANANMCRAIRRVSVAKGFDPADHVLVTFGGAGGQHACAIARECGMRQILVHPLAGILSAYGLGLADVRRHLERSILKAWSDLTTADLEDVFLDLERQVCRDVADEGIAPAQIDPPCRSLDLRYAGVEPVINVPAPTDGDYAAAYAERHRQLYGYDRPGRPVEVVAARVEAVGRTPHVAVERPAAEPHPPETRQRRDAWFDGRWMPVDIIDREQLQPGDRLNGPAIVCEQTGTTVIASGFVSEVTTRGELLITDERPASPDRAPRRAQPSTGVADPILLEIFNNLFASIAEQMGVTLQKTAVSTNVKERLDYSCALFDAAGELIVNAPHIPVHLGAMSETVRRVRQDHPHMSAGDVFVTNDPYRGGSHLPDVTVVTPVFGASGGLLFFTASRAHHAEIGGISPGSMPPFSRSLSDEGVLLRSFRLIDAGTSREEELQELLTGGPYPTRNLYDNLADISAQVAANQTGVRLMAGLLAEHSLPVVQSYMRHIREAAATKMRQALRDRNDGEYRFVDHLDDGSPICVSISICGDEAVVDFAGTGPVLPTNLNANRAIVTSAVLYVFRCLINEDIPLNSGVLEPIEIRLPECLLNPPEHEDPARCAAVVGGNVETSQRVVDVLLGALHLAAASQGTMNNLTFGDTTFGYYETICGGSGATPDGPGADAVHTHMTNTRLTDVEVIERRYPVRIREFRIRRGSGGAGQHRGGDGVVREIEFLKPLRVSLLTQRRGTCQPFGLEGGLPGAPGRNLLQRASTAEQVELPGCIEIDVMPGDVLTVETPGGGGFGNPAG